MRVTTSAETCVGSGQCVLAVPEIFDQDEQDGTVMLLEEWPPIRLHAAVRAAAVNCPVQAISVGPGRPGSTDE